MANLLNLLILQSRAGTHLQRRLPLAWVAACVSVFLLASGCALLDGSGRNDSGLPSGRTVVQDQLIFHSNFYFPKRHRLIEELLAKRSELESQLQLPPSSQPINIFLFEDGECFRDYMRKQYPSFPDRRAFFLKSADSLVIYAHWNSRVAEDLRHEVTHGYLHSVISDVPIWLDEGIAEYFEVPNALAGLNVSHARYLQQEHEAGRWEPDLSRLEQLRQPGDLNQTDYAESWLWVHYMLNDGPRTRKLLHDQLARLRMAPATPPLEESFAQIDPDAKRKVIAHLESLNAQ